VFAESGGILSTSTSSPYSYGYAYSNSLTISDHSVEADISFSNANTYGGGISGRLDPSSGSRYSVWIYPEGSPATVGMTGPAIIRLIKFFDWSSWAIIGQANIATVGIDWHRVRLNFIGNRIQVFLDSASAPLMDVVDNGIGGAAFYQSGLGGIDFYAFPSTQGPSYNNFVINDQQGNSVYNENFGSDGLMDIIYPWSIFSGGWTVVDGSMQSNAAIPGYAYAYFDSAQPLWNDYTVEASIQLAPGAYAGGIGGRVNSWTGAHYGAWIYPDGSWGGSNILKLIKFASWTGWSGTPIVQVQLPSVGSTWHTLAMTFSGNRIRIYVDGLLQVDAVDEGFSGMAPFTNGGISLDTWTPSGLLGSYGVKFDNVVVRP
jgi:hypothetical protein